MSDKEYTHEELEYFADEWFPPYITTKVEPVAVLPKVCMNKDDFEFIRALNLPAGSKVVRTGKYLQSNDDWSLNERHYNQTFKELNNG